MSSNSDSETASVHLDELRPLASLQPGVRREFERRAQFENYDRGDVVRDQHVSVDDAIFVVGGQVKVVSRRIDNAQIILGIFGPRHPSGGLGLFDDTYPGRIEALSSVETAELPPSVLRRILSELDAGLEPFFEVTCERGRHLARRLHDATVRPAKRRLALVFEMFRDIWGHPVQGGDGIRVPLSIRRRDLADLINTRTETAIRLVRDWERAGLVRTESEGFFIPEPDELDIVAAEA